MYERFLKRFLDITISLVALIILFPILVVLTIVGAIAMGGNPFFVQSRPGKLGSDGKERIFKMIKFRTMSNKKDKDGNLLPDEERLNKYGRFLRTTSLDELGELVNVLVGDMSIVGPRPLLVRYLPYYTEMERQRHSVRPGVTGLAQVNGRNNLDWDARLALDVEYVNKMSLKLDVKIILLTVYKVLKRSDVVSGNQMILRDLDDVRRNKDS